MASSRSDPALGFHALRDDLAELATVVLAQVERAVAGWEESDPAVAEVVADTDREVDVRSAALEERILELHRNWSAFAGDLRLLHVGLIAAVALERVGNLAVQIARLAGSVPPPEAEMSTVRGLVARMGERAVDALAESVQAIARGDLAAGERAMREARSVSPMLDGVLRAVTEAAGSPGMRAWSAAAVLVARHVERVANNAAELGARVAFLVTGRRRRSRTGERAAPRGAPDRDARTRPRPPTPRARTSWRSTSTCARGALEVRHPRRHGPVLWDREGVRRARGPSATLGPLLAALPAGAEPMIDLKGGAAGLAREALAAARAAGVPRVTLTSRRWRLLDGVAGQDGVRLAYSAAGRRELARLLGRALPDGAAACVRSDLLDADAVAALRRRHPLVMTWDVADRAHAERLVALGVGGLVLDDPALLAALAGARALG